MPLILNSTLSGTSTNAVTASYAKTASFVDGTVISASYAISASYVSGSVQVETGSLVLTSSFNEYTSSGASIFSGTASLALTASYFSGSIETASFAYTASYLSGSVESASYAQTASYVISSSYALTASYAMNVDTSSVVSTASFHEYTSSGASIFSGTSSLALTASYFSGSVETASFAFTASYLSGSVETASFAFTASFLSGSVETASFALTASYLSGSVETASFALTASYLSGSAETASFAFTASYLSGSIESASYAATASYALTASFLSGSVESASYAATASLANIASRLENDNYIFTKFDGINVTGFPLSKGMMVTVNDMGNLNNPVFVTAGMNQGLAAIGMVISGSNDGDTCTVLNRGFVELPTTFGADEGDPLYLGDNTLLTNIKPSGSFFQVVGKMVQTNPDSSSRIFIDCDNQFQYTTSTSSFISTGSLAISQSISGTLNILGNLNVLGTASFTTVTASSVEVSQNTIAVFANSSASLPTAGYKVIDSASLSVSSSLLYNVSDNNWTFTRGRVDMLTASIADILRIGGNDDNYFLFEISQSRLFVKQIFSGSSFDTAFFTR